MLEELSPSGGEAAEFIEWQSEIAAFAAVDRLDPAPSDAVLFVGSSSIRLWHTLAADFPELPTINRGFGGSEIADSVYFAEQLVGTYRPRAIVMYAGGNDLADGKSPEQVRDAFGAFITQARRWAGEVPIAYLSIKPNLSRRGQLPQIRAANALIRACAQEAVRTSWTSTRRCSAPAARPIHAGSIPMACTSMRRATRCGPGWCATGWRAAVSCRSVAGRDRGAGLVRGRWHRGRAQGRSYNTTQVSALVAKPSWLPWWNTRSEPSSTSAAACDAFSRRRA